jgi:hypothetical protein
MLAYIVVSAVYSITESGFRSPQPMSVFLLLAIFSASGIAVGLIGREKAKSSVSSAGRKCTADVIDELLPNTESAYTNWPVFAKGVREQS